jgi:uncharacterized protein YjbI with pentapeptide repeats
MGRLAGGLLVGVLGAIAWAARRQAPARAEPPPPANQPPGRSGPSGGPPPAPPLARSRTTTRFDLWAFLGLSVAIAIASMLVYVVVRPPSWVLIGAIASGTVLLAACVLVFPHLLAPSRTPKDLAGEGLSARDRIQFEDDRRKLQNDVRTALLQAVVGGAVLVGVLFTWQQQQATSRQVADQLAVARQGQVGERFSRAVDQLGSGSIDVRLGGLYELEQLARQAPERRLVIIEVVAAFVREHARPPATSTGPQANAPPSAEAPAPPQDVAAALTILGRRPIHDGDPRVDLSRVKLGGLNLVEVRLRDAHLDRADLRGADLRGADLRGAVFDFADLRGTNVRAADLRGAHLGFPDLRGADLRGADLRGAVFDGADLRGAVFDGANLRGTTIGLSDLRGADLRGAHLRGADLYGARADRLTQWPEGFDWRGAGVEQR